MKLYFIYDLNGFSGCYFDSSLVAVSVYINYILCQKWAQMMGFINREQMLATLSFFSKSHQKKLQRINNDCQGFRIIQSLINLKHEKIQHFFVWLDEICEKLKTIDVQNPMKTHFMLFRYEIWPMNRSISKHGFSFGQNCKANNKITSTITSATIVKLQVFRSDRY